MKRTRPVVLGVLIIRVGGVWSFQGMGYLEGSPMTGSSFWAITGSIVAGLGVGFVLAGLKKRE